MTCCDVIQAKSSQLDVTELTRTDDTHWKSSDGALQLGTIYGDSYWALTAYGNRDEVFCYASKIHPCPDTQSGWKCWSSEGEWVADVKFRLECLDREPTTT